MNEDQERIQVKKASSKEAQNTKCLRSITVRLCVVQIQSCRNFKEYICLSDVGTAGVWRIHAINEAGGWKDRTTVEDMDLAVRAGLGGWKFVYIGNIKVHFFGFSFLFPHKNRYFQLHINFFQKRELLHIMDAFHQKHDLTINSSNSYYSFKHHKLKIHYLIPNHIVFHLHETQVVAKQKR